MKTRSHRLRQMGVAAGATVLMLAVAACGAGRTDGGDSGGAAADGQVIIGTTDKVVSVDPAGSYDYGSSAIQWQIFQWLVSVKPGGTELEMDAAESCSYAQPTVYSCTLKDGLTFTNGDPLTSADVKFSIDRIITINDPNGPASLLGNLDSVEAPDPKTVNFNVKVANDATFPYVLAANVGPIVDSKVMSATALETDPAKFIGSGPYKIKSFKKDEIVEFEVNADYKGSGVPAKNTGVILKSYADAQNLKLDVESGAIDVAWRTLGAQDIADLKTKDNVKVVEGAGGNIRYMVFNLNTMPGDTYDQKRAIRRAAAFSIDRQALADKVYQGTYAPLYSMLPSDVPGGIEAFKTEFGDKPDAAKAKAELEAAGVSIPVEMNIQYNPDHYGENSDQEYNEIKAQLEATGLFKINLQATEWATYSKERVADAYPVYQLGWFPDFPDPDNYISPFFTETNFVKAHYCDEGATDRPCDKDGVQEAIKQQLSMTGTERDAVLADIQTKTTQGSLPYLPLLVGKQVVATVPEVTGVEDTLDPSFVFRMWMVSKG